MQDVVESGTARSASPGINICAKTGTAENILFSMANGSSSQQLHVCLLCPEGEPQIAIAVAVENAGFGSTSRPDRFIPDRKIPYGFDKNRPDERGGKNCRYEPYAFLPQAQTVHCRFHEGLFLF